MNTCINRNKSSLLLHPLFIVCLLLLLANDHWWKHAYGNWLTGKLSDFTGVFVFTVFLIVLIPAKRIYAVLIAAIAFTWWKSSLSQPFIDWHEYSLHLRLSRVVDYWDLTALMVLPLAYILKPVQIKFHAGYYWLRPVVMAVTVLSMMATTVPYRNIYYHPQGYIHVYYRYKTSLTEDEFLQKLDSMQIAYYRDSVDYLPTDAPNYYLRVQPATDSSIQWIPLNSLHDTALYYRDQSLPYYRIPLFVLEKDTIRNITFRVDDNGRKRIISLVSMDIPPDMHYTYYMQRPVRKKYKALLQSIFKE